MNKKLLAVVAVLTIGTTLSGPAFAASKDHVKTEVTKKVKEEKQPKKAELKQLSSIDKQLEKIEKKVIHYKEKLSNLEDPINPMEDEKDDSVAEEDPTNEEIADNGIKDTTESNLAAAAAAFNNISKGSVNPDVIDDSQSDETYGNVVDVSSEDDDSVPTDEELEKEAEEVESELNEYPGYAGKFHALQNRLNAVANRLDSLASKGIADAELQPRYDYVELLNTQISAVLTTISQVQNEVIEESSHDESAKEVAPIENVPMTKEWTIQFSKEIDTDTLSNLDIVVLDEEKNLIETLVNYSETTKSVTLMPLQPYKAGESYTLYIGKKITDDSGSELMNSVKMNFAVE